jgi:hypothetical protein
MFLKISLINLFAVSYYDEAGESLFNPSIFYLMILGIAGVVVGGVAMAVIKIKRNAEASRMREQELYLALTKIGKPPDKSAGSVKAAIDVSPKSQDAVRPAIFAGNPHAEITAGVSAGKTEPHSTGEAESSAALVPSTSEGPPRLYNTDLGMPKDLDSDMQMYLKDPRFHFLTRDFIQADGEGRKKILADIADFLGKMIRKN